ncbi:shikimate dehydrogenase [Camelimonas abortus]|uniref:Shikimate dehydrogenase (NADP(+)) n=1 Tax=Camelimonas abortus TaxID=1017184 RepID=A0ABV7LC05_9HYPH
MPTKACVIGDPVAHSRSPIIHNYWLREAGIAGVYERQRVTAGELADFLGRIRAGEYAGCNVTVPHKEAAASLVDRRTPTAERLGAVNTVWLEQGELWGDNTDVAGFLGNLDELGPGWDKAGGKAVVLGAGGAARAIVSGLLERGFTRVLVANRSFDRAERLAQACAGGSDAIVSAVPWEERSARLEGARLLVNTTSLGMSGQPALTIDLSLLPPDALVTDIVYSPLETDLLKLAKARGLATVDGLGMLLHQAVPGFRRWFGVTPQVTPQLRQLVINDMNGGSA